MDNITFPKCTIGDLPPGSWVRTSGGDVGVIHDKVDQPGYRKAMVEFPGHRYPNRIMRFEEEVEHVTECRRSQI